MEDTEHSDFIALRSVLFGSHLQELRDITHEVLYEKYRTEKLSEGRASFEEYVSPVFFFFTLHLIINIFPLLLSLFSSRSFSRSERGFIAPTIPTTTGTNSHGMYLDQKLLKDIEEKVHKEIETKRKELLLREEQLRDIEARLSLGVQGGNNNNNNTGTSNISNQANKDEGVSNTIPGGGSKFEEGGRKHGDTGI